MEDLFTKVLTAIASTTLLVFVFWRISLILPKPEGKTSSLKNFHCVHPASFINKRFRPRNARVGVKSPADTCPSPSNSSRA